MEYFALMTRDFKVIKADKDGYLYSVPFSSLKTLDNVIYLAQQGDHWNLLILEPFMSWFDNDTKRTRRAFPSGFVTLIPQGQKNYYQIQFNDHTYPYVTEAGRIAYSSDISLNREAFSHFRLMTQSELKILSHIACHKWALDPVEKSVSVSEGRSNFREFYLGDLPITLDDFFEINDVSSISNEFIFLSGNNIYRAVLLNPVIFLVSYNDQAFGQLKIALSSLEDPGDYNGKLVILADFDPVTVLSIVPERLRANTEVFFLKAYDFLDYVAARQSMVSSGIMEQYSPILYIDVDVMINLPLDKTLCQGALGKWFSAQREEWSENADFRHIETVGALFYKQDPFPVKRAEAGFNSGVFFLPDPKRNKNYMDRAFYGHMAYALRKGRKIPFPEQQFLNYALRKLDAVDCDLVTSLTEVGGDPKSRVIEFHGGMNVEKPRGIIHYWCIPTHNRPRLMMNYLQRVRDHRKTLQ